ncbi:hypothetical protein D6C76_05361 [Aureobasidium pullulans]|nr:hypothetical protein D6C76_05361 [Aureobasidium pullulans]
MDSPIEIKDDFKLLTPTEQYEAMADLIAQFADQMLDNNKRIFSRVLDIIGATDTKGHKTLHLDMLATHLAMETSEILEVKSWNINEFDLPRNITSLDDLRAQSRLGNIPGTHPWKSGSSDYITGFLQSLETAVRKNASRELLGDAAETLELPAPFCEFFKHTGGVTYPNLDRQMFVCSFGDTISSAQEQAQPLEKMCERAPSFGFEVAAGWKAGDNDQNTWIHYLLCKEVDEPNEPWEWRIFINNINFQDFGYYDTLGDFLVWYSGAFDWVDWDAVQSHVDDLCDKCKRVLEVDEG